MGMRIDSSYNNYPVNRSTQTDTTRKTANDELSYLQDKFKDYSFVAANFRQGMRYGSNATTNVAISPQFLKKMANDPKLAEEYEKEIANMKSCDQWCRANIQARGDKLVADGWAIDKDGGISRWSIGTHDDRTARVKSPTEYANELYEKKKAAKKNDTAELLKSLQNSTKGLNIAVGSALNMSKDNKTGSVAINQKILDKAMNDPETAKKLSELVTGIEKAEKTVAGYYNSIGGVTERTSHWYIDENGNLLSFGYTHRDDKLNKKLREEAANNSKELIERSREKSRERAKELAEKLTEKDETAKAKPHLEKFEDMRDKLAKGDFLNDRA